MRVLAHTKIFHSFGENFRQPYTCFECATNCRDAPTHTHEETRKQQLTSCIYVANLMQLRGCEWWYVACATPRSRFKQG
jgi:hypothetical protein